MRTHKYDIDEQALLNGHAVAGASLWMGSTAAMSAVEFNQVETFRLLSPDCNLTLFDNSSCTVITKVVMSGNEAFLDVLREQGCTAKDLDQPNSQKVTSLMLSVSLGSPRAGWTISECGGSNQLGCVRRLIDYGCDIDATDDQGRTVASMAVSGSHAADRLMNSPCGCLGQRTDPLPLLRLLHSKGCNMAKPDLDGRTAAWWASFHGYEHSLRFLLTACGCNPNVKTRGGESLSWRAALHGHIGCLRALADSNADLNALSVYGESPLEAAERSVGRYHRQTGCAQFLRAHHRANLIDDDAAQLDQN